MSHPLLRICGIFLLSALLPVLSWAEDTQLQNGVPFDTFLNPLTYANAYIDVPAGATAFTVTVTNGSGDIDLYVKFGGRLTGGTIEELSANADARSESTGPGESITLTGSSSPPLKPGRWYIAALNLNSVTTHFKLTATYVIPSADMPLPTATVQFSYKPVAAPVKSTDAAAARPLAVGAPAGAPDKLSIKVGLGAFAGAVDLYFAVYAPGLSPDIYLLHQDYSLKPATAGILPWKRAMTGPLDEAPFGEFDSSALPQGVYLFYLVAAPAGRLDAFYLWDTYTLVVRDGSVGSYGGNLVAPGATIFHQGQLYQDKSPAPDSGLVGIWKDNKPYLYHPAMGAAELSDYNSRRAVGYFIVGENAEPELAAANFRALLTPDCAPLAVRDKCDMDTGIYVDRADANYATAENKFHRWAAVKTSTGQGPFFLVPSDKTLDTNLFRFVGLQSLDRVINVQLSAGTLETYGATLSSLSDIIGKKITIAGRQEAIQKDKELYEKLNRLDMMWMANESTKTFLAAVPTKCFDVFSDLYFNLDTLDYVKLEEADPATVEFFRKTLCQDFKYDIVNCLVSAVAIIPTSGVVTIGIELFNFFMDIIGAASWVIEDVALHGYQLAKAPAYGEVEFTPANACSEASVARTWLVTEYKTANCSGDDHYVPLPWFFSADHMFRVQDVGAQREGPWTLNGNIVTFQRKTQVNTCSFTVTLNAPTCNQMKGTWTCVGKYPGSGCWTAQSW